MSSNYTAPVYQPPTVLTAVSKLLDAPRKEYSQDIAHYIAVGGSADDNNYRAGLVFLACIIGGFVFMWAFVLVVLKCKGRAVGCAAGFPFERVHGDTKHATSKEGGSTDLDDDMNSSSHSKKDSQLDIVNFDGVQNREVSSMRSSIPSADLDGSSSIESGSEMSLEEYSVESQNQYRHTRRERLTKIAFITFGAIALACVPLALIFAHKPVKESSIVAGDNIEKVQNLIDQVRISLSAISSAANNSVSLVENTTLDLDVLCPLLSKDEASNVFGFDVQEMLDLFQVAYTILDGPVQLNLSDFNASLTRFEAGVRVVDGTYSDVNGYLWVVPGTLIAVGFLTTITLFGVMMSWSRRSDLRMQRLLSYGILPFFIAFTIACWIIAIAAAVTTAAGGDACTYTTVASPGSPDNLITAVLKEKSVSMDDGLYRFIQAYTSRCDVQPTQGLVQLQESVQDTADFIWTRLSAIDSRGRTRILTECGGDHLGDFLSKASSLAKLLASIRNAIGITADSITCEKVNPLYVNVMYESVCTDAVSGAAWGFVIFFVLGVAMLCMITLRAAFRHNIKEDQIYEESEVAENMIVDEHEEYLAYISKYRHEWQDYEGLEPTLGRQAQPDVTPAEISYDQNSHRVPDLEHSESSYTEQLQAQSESPYSQGKRAESFQENFDPYVGSDSDNKSHSTSGDISFPSLVDSLKQKLSLLPQPLLVPREVVTAGSDDGREIDELLAPAASMDNTISTMNYSLGPAVATMESPLSDDDNVSLENRDPPSYAPVEEAIILESTEAVEIVSRRENPQRKASFLGTSVRRVSKSEKLPLPMVSSSVNCSPRRKISRKTFARSSSSPIERRSAKILEDLESLVGEDDALYSTIGKVIRLEAPRRLSSLGDRKSSSGSVKNFMLEEDRPESLVSQQVENLMKKSRRIQHPWTSTRPQKDKSGKLDSLSSVKLDP